MLIRQGRKLMEKDFERFLQDLKFSGKAENTIETYRLRLKLFSDFIHERGVKDYRKINGKETRAFRDWLARHGLSPATINLSLSAVRAFYEYLVFDGVVKGNPVSRRLNVKEPDHLPAFLTKEEEEKVFGWFRMKLPQATKAFETMRATGIRVSEAAALTGRDVLLMNERVFLHIRAGKGKKERYVPVLSVEIAKQLLELADVRHDKRLFGFTAGTLKVYAHKCQKATGIDFHSHRLRHTVGTSLLAEGVPLDVIQQVLGHANIATTRLYATTMPEKIMALAASLEG
jgi:site-specific recombinase XerD